MQFKRQNRSQVDVNITPLIDVVFLLLIFFMVSTTFTREAHLSLDLPEADGEASEQQLDQIEIVISADGQYVVNGQSLVNNKIDTLMIVLEEVSGGDVGVPLIITADASTPHQVVVSAMDAAGRKGFTRLGLTTKKPEQE